MTTFDLCYSIVLQPKSHMGVKGKAAFNQVSEYIHWSLNLGTMAYPTETNCTALN